MYKNSYLVVLKNRGKLLITNRSSAVNIVMVTKIFVKFAFVHFFRYKYQMVVFFRKWLENQIITIWKNY